MLCMSSAPDSPGHSSQSGLTHGSFQNLRASLSRASAVPGHRAEVDSRRGLSAVDWTPRPL